MKSFSSLPTGGLHSVMKNALDIFHSGYSSPSFARVIREFFLALHQEKLMGFPEAKPVRMWCFLRLQPPGVSCSHIIMPTLSLKQLINVSILLFLPVCGSSSFCSRWADLSSVSLDLPVSPYFGGIGLPCHLTLQMGQEKSLTFSFLSLFSYGKDGSDEF